jgi:hypothetical protein
MTSENGKDLLGLKVTWESSSPCYHEDIVSIYRFTVEAYCNEEYPNFENPTDDGVEVVSGGTCTPTVKI